jgi:GTP pyrophosphokinase
MKSHSLEPQGAASLPEVIAATSEPGFEQVQVLIRARTFAEPLLLGETLPTGENTLAHADAVAAILKTIGGSQAMQAASFLVYASAHLNKPQEVIAKAFGDNFADLAMAVTKLVQVEQQARSLQVGSQNENVRKMLLAFSRDLRVVMLRLASRLQTLRYYAASKKPVSPGLAAESLQVFAPLANRLGIWEVKWELEDLSFRFLEPDTYRQVARLLDEKRTERETYVEQLRLRLAAELQIEGIAAQVTGRPKHIYSIVKKMRGKSLGFDQLYDIRALRIVVNSVPDCYAALSWVHSQFQPLTEEFDDYIAKPKPNGYQSLHTIVRNTAGQAIEIQIRTQAMHDHAEHGVAAHWAYKEAGAKGYTGVSASSAYDAKIAVLRQLLAWERDLTGDQQAAGVFEDRIYVLTPDAAIVELPQGATAVDFAYSVHTNLGHRCRGARVDGALVPLNTPLKNGQTVEVVVVKEGGPSRDWLNPELGFLASPRARSKVRAWFNALAMHETVARGREAVEKLLQRLGKTAVKLDDLASQLGFNSADDLFEVVGKDEFSLHSIEAVLRPPEVAVPQDEQALLKKSSTDGRSQGGVLVVGVDSLLTQLAKCCKPAPPDAIRGFVTRGKGVSVHRADCVNLREMSARNADRLIDVDWGQPKLAHAAPHSHSPLYPVDVIVQAAERLGLLRDVTEVFTKQKINVVAAHTQSSKGAVWMTLTVEVTDAGRLTKVLEMVAALGGVRSARRR